MISKPRALFFMLSVVLSITGIASCTTLGSTPTPIEFPTTTSTTSPTKTSIPEITLTPSPIATVSPTDQKLLDALDKRTRFLFNVPASEIIDFLLEIQDNVRTDNKEELANMIYYPIMIYGFDGNNDKEIQNTAEFVVNYDKIVTPEWKEKVLAQEPIDLFTNWQGVMISRGELWFSPYCIDKDCQETKLYIITINHTDW